MSSVNHAAIHHSLTTHLFSEVFVPFEAIIEIPKQGMSFYIGRIIRKERCKLVAHLRNNELSNNNEQI